MVIYLKKLWNWVKHQKAINNYSSHFILKQLLTNKRYLQFNSIMEIKISSVYLTAKWHLQEMITIYKWIIINFQK